MSGPAQHVIAISPFREPTRLRTAIHRVDVFVAAAVNPSTEFQATEFCSPTDDTAADFGGLRMDVFVTKVEPS
jgi:hypothetical protein